MTFGFMSLAVAFGLGVVFTIAFFVYGNVKRPDVVDKAEDVVRNRKF